MDAWTGAEPPDLQPDDSAPDDSAPDESAPGGSSSRAVSLAGLTVAGFTRRRAAWLAGVLVAAWIVVVFARQVGDASAKAAETVQARAANAEVAAEVAALQRELDLVQRPQYIEQQAHGIGLGSAKDHAFTLAPDAPPLASDAPGSASVRLGAPASIPSPLDTWLDLLFGPDPGS
jgi:cell division protein FtsB